MGLAPSRIDKSKSAKEKITFCVICYENEIKSQTLHCGHAFCSDCISSIYEYEDIPRCPLCRQYICFQTSKPLNKNYLSWFKINRKIAHFSAVGVSCGLFWYNISPMLQGYLQDWDFTMMQRLLNNFRIEYAKVKGIWF
ncbi:E3 ubiquitin-protein ligase TRIM21-like [Bradysia coprophila]|uniref:E3 ubiquitin-protein ligase TRIM21-like n=1 Tax=Bradysia coprophila TaxID=38358 RepID=UPI00187DC2E7|nr:E3 ubiquitin-protein ligase TRIM21-like [Bradysia coprophila]